jgi:DNA-binding transcriptional LysR family regulator
MDAAGQAARGGRGRLAAGYSGTSTYELLPIMTRLFRAECPAVTLVLRGEMLTPALETALLHRDLDVAFLRPPVAAPELQTRILRRERLGVLLPEKHPLARLGEVDLAALAQEPFVTHPAQAHGVMYSITQRACVAAGFRPEIVQEASETSVVASLVAAGIGVAILPLSVRYIHITGAVLRPLTSRDLEIELAIAWRREDASPTVARFLTIATNALAQPA